MNNLVYVIIPVYNTESYLHNCVDSILNQTYKNIKLIIVDDGSTDNCPAICDNYEKSDGRVKVIHKNNGGLSYARNVALDYISGKPDCYVTFIDSDDWVENNYIEKLVCLLEKNKADIVCTSFIYGNNSHHTHQNIKKECSLSGIEATKLLLKDETIQSHVCTKVYKIGLWKYVRFDEKIHYMEDQCTTYKLFYNANKVYISNYTGYHYRQNNPNSLTKSKINNKKVISGLKGYYYPCLYEGFKKEDRIYLLPSIHNALVNAYLMLIPYYKARLATDDEKAFIKELKKYIKDNKLIKQFVPNGKNNMIKKRLYRMCPVLYPFLFKIGKRLVSI